MKKLNVMLEDKNSEKLEAHKKKNDFPNLDMTVNDMIDKFGEDKSE